jgi:hypothetical protein
MALAARAVVMEIPTATPTGTLFALSILHLYCFRRVRHGSRDRPFSAHCVLRRSDRRSHGRRR